MIDYISRQAAIIEMMDNNVDHAQGTDGREVVQILSDIPAADVVPVVRCKDCRKCIYDSLFDQLWCNMTLVTRRVKPDDFCSYSKRKE